MESLSVEVKFEVRGKLDTVPWLPNLGSSKFMSEIISNLCLKLFQIYV